MFNIFEDQLIDDIVSQVEQSRISYNLQREEFHNLNTNLQTYLDNIKTIDNDNYHLQEDIQQIRTNYISTLENYLKRLLNDFRQLSQQLTDIHIDRYKYKSRARRIINEREEFKRRINFIANNEKEQIKCLNFLQKKERTVRNELLKLNEQLQHCLKYVENEKQTHQQAMNKVDNLQVQLEQICVERSKTEFEIQTLKEEIKLMQTAKDFLDEERETILATETEANEYLLSRLDESITCIREDFEQLNKTQLKQVENEYKNMLKIVEEHFTTDESTISHQHTNQIERKQLQEEYQHVLQDLTTLNNHNQVLSKQILTMEVEFHSLHDERIQQLISKDNEIQRTKIELQTLKEKLNHLTEYDRNLKFELTLYRGVLESEHRRQQRQKQSSINTSHLRRPTTLQSNNNLMTDNKTTLLTTSSINQSKFNDQQEEVLITRNRTQSEYDTLGEDTNIQIENILSIKPSSSDEKFVSQEILQQQVIESFDQEHEQDRINVNIIPQDIEKSSSSSSTTVLTEDQLIPSFETQQSSSYTLPISSETRKSLTSSIPSVIREDQSVFSPVQQLSVTPTELRSLPIIPSTNQEISPTETTPVLSEVHQLPLVSPQEPQTLFEISKPLTTSTLEEDHQTISEVPQSLSEISSEVPTITSDIQSSPSSPTIPVTTEYQQLTTDIYEPLSTSSHEHQPLSHASTTPITSEYQQLTSDVHEPHTTLSHEHQLSSHISVIPPDIERLSPLPNTQPIVEYQQLDTDLSLWHASSDASIIPFDIQRRPSSPTTSPITEYQQLVSDLHESSSTVSEDREISSEIQIFPSQNVPTTNIDIQENVVPMTIDDYQTTTLVENESNVENQLNKSFNEIDHHEYDQSIHFIESSQIEQYEIPLDTKLNESQSLSFSLSDIKQDESQQSSSPTNLNILSDNDNKLELKQDDISEEIQREEEISSSLTDQTQNDYSTDFTSSLIINDDHKNDNEEDKFNPLPTQDINKQLSRNTSLSDIQEVDDLPISQKIEIISDDDDDPSLAVIMQDLRYVFHELANNEDLVEINNDLPDKLLERLEFRDHLIRTLFDSLLRKYLVQSAAQENRPKTLDWIEFRDILFPIITGRYTERHIRKLFDLFDTTRDGHLSLQEIAELLEILQANNTINLAQNIIDEYDTDHDGKLSVDELIEAIKKTDDINEHVLSEETENKQWFNQTPIENQPISLEIPIIIFPTETNDKYSKEISLLGRIFKNIGADSNSKLLDSNNKNLLMEIINEFINNNINISINDLQSFIELYINKKQNTNSFINWNEFRDIFLPFVNHGYYTIDNIQQWFDIFDISHDEIITHDQVIQLLRLLQIENPEKIMNKLNEITETHTNDDDLWTFNELIFALDNVDETCAHLITNNEHIQQITTFDIDWLSNNVF